MAHIVAILSHMGHLFTFFHQGRFRLFPRRSILQTSVPMGQVPQSAPANPPDPLPGRDFMFSLIREHLAMQHQAADQQDTKASGILIGATTMVGFAFLIQHHPVGNCSALFPIWLHRWSIVLRLALPYVLFLVFYTSSMICALQASRIRGYWIVPDPVKALKSMDKTEPELKLSLSQAMAHYSKINEKTLDRKAYWNRWAGRMLLCETLTLVLLLLYQTVC
jgi:hypothetical protein